MHADVQQLQTPFFLVGSVRSGTTVLRLMLGHHSQICRCEEMDYVTPALVGRGEPCPVSDYVEQLRRDRAFLMSGYDIPEGLGFEDLVNDFFAQRSRLDGAPMVGATVHHHFEELSRLFPDAKFVFLRRDPRDVARSCVKMGWAGNAWGGAHYWLRANESWNTLRGRVPADNCLEVSYEQLLADTRATMNEVCSFLGVSFEESMLEIDKTTTYERPNPKVAQSWRDTATRREIAEVEACVGEQQLRACGYQPSGLPGLKLSPARRRLIRIYDLLGRCRRRIQIYGLSLWFQSMLSRRLPSERYRRYCQRRIDAVDNKNLK